MATNQALALSWAAKEKAYPLPCENVYLGKATEPGCGDELVIGLAVDDAGIVREAGFSLTESACPPVRS